MEEKDTYYAKREKHYIQGKQFPFIKVGMQKVNLTPTVNVVDGEKVTTPNDPVLIYDTSGPFSDPNITIDLKKGLARMREPWILERGNVEQLPEISSEYGRMRRDDHSLDHLRFEALCRTVQRPASRLPRWPTPRLASSLRKWSTSPSARI